MPSAGWRSGRHGHDMNCNYGGGVEPTRLFIDEVAMECGRDNW